MSISARLKESDSQRQCGACPGCHSVIQYTVSGNPLMNVCLVCVCESKYIWVVGDGA